jgi:hypothetical protein
MNKHPEIDKLSGHLQASLAALRGKVLGPAPHFRPSLLIPVAAIVGAAVLLTMSPRARNNLLMKVAMLVSTQLLHNATEKGVNPHEQSEE